ncbi:2,3-diaminopropionate biosynthesis protein SbnA [Saccharopolyspora shandongensis]|uniref:2,3-diaminopropionate biosynthesis protein SbnA n=1 Tax=Saccharopolyspora shandongensis TaxID=418495 RepID=UPI00341223BC
MAAVISSPLEFNVEDIYVDLQHVVGRRLLLKCEGFNFAGSVKLKAAVEMVDALERDGRLRPGGVLIESSSGNMGVALSMVAAHRGYRFVCVTDVRCNRAARRWMEALGSEVHVISEPDREGGFLAARLAHVRELLRADPGYVWLNQYANPGNWRGHYRTTGPEIAKAFPDLDVLFVGAGTTGTLMGCARYFRENQPGVTVVAVDSVGSVTFGAPAGQRLIPGLGTGVRPQILEESYVDDVVHVAESDTIAMCRRMVRCGFLFGGSTGTVVCGALEWLRANRAGDELTALAIAPDMGVNYLDTVYDGKWVERSFGAAPTDPSADH